MEPRRGDSGDRKKEIDADRGTQKSFPMLLGAMMAKLASNPAAMAGLGHARMRGLSRSMWGRELPWAAEGSHVALSTGAATACSRSARLFMPSSAKPGAPLMVMLHGCMQDSKSFARLTRMDALAAAEGFNVLYPDQESSANPMLCWNWNAVENQSRSGGEPEALADLLMQAQALCGTAPARTRLAGLSAGGALAATMAHLYPELVGAVAAVGGPAPFAANDVPTALDAMSRGPSGQVASAIGAKAGQAGGAASGAPRRMPMLIVQGMKDETVHPKHAKMHEFSALALNAALAIKSRVALGLAPDTGSRPEEVLSKTRGGQAKTWFDADGALVACVVTPAGLGHAWSGGDMGEPFAQEGFDQSRLAIDFFEAAESGAAGAFEPAALAKRLWGKKNG